MPVSAEGRVEHQKLNQTAALLSFGWVFGVQLDLLEKKWLVQTIKPWRELRNLWMAPYAFSLFPSSELEELYPIKTNIFDKALSNAFGCPKPKSA